MRNSFMLYTFFKIIFKLGLRGYFKKVKVSGLENIPAAGPMLFVANHPSTLMDPIVVGAIVPPALHFLAASEYMGNKFTQRLLGNLFNMIPVYRKTTTPSKTGNNMAIFERCFEHFKKDGSILIFPEGNSVTENRLRPLKTGAARLAYGAIEHIAEDKNVAIVPVGLNYTDPHLFQSQLFVKIGQPIYPDKTQDTSAKEPIVALTQQIEDALKANLIHIETDEIDDLYEKLVSLTQHQYMYNHGKKPSAEYRFELNKEIQEGLNFFLKNNPKVVHKMHQEIDDYLDRAQFYRVSDATIAQAMDRVPLSDYIKIILGLPIFIIGFVANALPYYLTVFLYRKIKVDEAFKGSIGLTAGVILYLLYYVGIAVAFHNLIGYVTAFAGLVVIHLCGLFTLKYFRLVYALKQKGRLNNLFKRQRNVSLTLVEERKAIIAKIEEYASQVPA